MRTKGKLTVKEEIFVNAIVAGETALDAYKAAYKHGAYNTMKAQSHRVTKRTLVAAEIKKRKAELAKKSEITVETLLIELEEARGVGKAESSASGMVAATMGKAKLLGLDKLVIEMPGVEKILKRSFNDFYKK